MRQASDVLGAELLGLALLRGVNVNQEPDGVNMNTRGHERLRGEYY